MNNKPLVSVCIPSYNHAQFLSYCIESVLSQTYPNIEIIIVDDGSKDSSLEIAQSYADSYPDRVRVYTHPNKENRGISNTVNLCFSLSKGKYWSGLSSDDAFYKDKIEKQVEFLEVCEELGFVYSYGDYIDADGNRLPGRFGINITCEPDPVEILIAANVIPGMSILARRDAVERVGLHDPDLIYSDWDFWIRFFILYKAGFIEESLIEYRVHDYNTSVNIKPLTGYKNSEQVYLKLGKDLTDTNSILHERKKYHKLINSLIADLPNKKAVAHLENYFTTVDSGNFIPAFSDLRQALALSPKAVLKKNRILAVIKHAMIGGISFFRKKI